MTNKKIESEFIRGFRKISNEQFEKDIKSFNGVKYEDIQLPERGTALSAGYDIFSPFDFHLKPEEDIKIPTGICSYMLEDEALFAYPRSGQGFKFFVRLANTIGIIDADYYSNPSNDGNIGLALFNQSNEPVELKAGERVAQGIFVPFLVADNGNTDNVRQGGTGSTNK